MLESKEKDGCSVLIYWKLRVYRYLNINLPPNFLPMRPKIEPESRNYDYLGSFLNKLTLGDCNI